jgi:hypothetical protein
MPVKAVIETLEGLNEDLQALYVEQDGVFVLDIEDIKVHPATKPLQVALERLKGEASDTKAKLTDALTKLEAKPNPTKAEEAEMVRLRESLEKERDEAIAKAAGLEKQVYNLTVENQLESLLRSAGVTEPTFVRLAKRDLADKVTVADGKAVVRDAELGDFALGDFIKHYVSGEGAALVTKPQGAGVKGGESNGSKPAIKGNLAGSKEERVAALKAKFPDLA